MFENHITTSFLDLNCCPVKGVLASAPLCYESGSRVFVLLAVVFFILIELLTSLSCDSLASFACQNCFKFFSSVSKTFSIKTLHLYTT